MYVSRLRAALGPDGRAVIERQGSGYRIPRDAISTDAARFARAVDEGARLLADNRATQAFDVLSDALRMWRGEPFADLMVAPDSVRGRLAELREVAVEQRCAAQLTAGDPARAVSELEGAVADAPYRERRWALLILGLYRCGRQSDALAALRRVRALLADELGVDPGPELQELERRVLAQDPRLQLAEPSPTGRPLSSFLGRKSELDRLATLLAERRMVTVIGPAGVGKTRLAVEFLVGRESWLVRLADVARPDVLAQAVADAVGLVEVAGEPRRALVRALSPRRGLLVLDNCEHLAGAVAEVDEARAAAEAVLAVGRRVGLDWLMVGGRMALGSALTRLGQVTRGEEMLHDAIRRAERRSLAWFAGWSELALAKSLITNAGKPAEIPGALRRSLRWFVHEGDTAQTLSVVHVAAGQLLADRPYEAVRLQAAVLHHAQLRGLAPNSIVQSGHGPIEPDLDHARRAAAEAEGVRLSWAQMLELVMAHRPEACRRN